MADIGNIEALLAKTASLPPLKEDSFQSYRVRNSGLEVTVKASSVFEAAVKMGFLLKEMNVLKPKDPTSIVVTNEREDRFKYNAIEDGELVAVQLIEKTMNALEDEALPIADRAEEGMANLSLYHLDINTELVDATLRVYFGYDSFRPLQKETIVTTMSGNNVLTVVGTGGGKTLMYLLPAVLASKPTRASLHQRCINLGITACRFTGDVPQSVRDEQLNKLDDFKVILTTPECLAAGEPLRLAIDTLNTTDKLERIVFDEAHTISTWGNTFRPVYKNVCESISRAGCPKLLLSATVPSRVERDLKEIFGGFTIHRRTVYRDNLFLEVVDRSGKFYDDLASYVKDQERKGASGIIYCVLPHDVSNVHAELLKRGINVVKYHGQLSEEVKVASHTKWMNGEVNIIVANSSFGMGIDKSNVRYVIHAKMPTGIDEYYQQCGRAGRDGLPSHCRLYYSHSDKNALLKLFQLQNDQHGNLNDLIVILEDPVQCRHKKIMAYFGELQESFVCLTGCDNCKQRGSYQITDGTSDALKVVQALVQLSGTDITVKQLKLFLAGSNQKSIAQLRKYSTFGSLSKKFVPLSLLDKFLHLLIVEEVLSEKMNKKGSSLVINVCLGPKAHAVVEFNLSITKYEKV